MGVMNKPWLHSAIRESRFIRYLPRSVARSTTGTRACGAGSETCRSHGESFRVEAQAYFDLGEHTLVAAALHGPGGQSGVEVAMPATGIATWRDGLCVAHKAYPHKEEALGQLGVTEDSLEPIAP
jgi:hypothetical protein